MSTETKDIPMFMVEGNVFMVDKATYSRSKPPGPRGQLVLVVHNKSGDWIDVNIARTGGVSVTGHIPDGQDGGLSESLDLYTHYPNLYYVISRWRPGFLGVPGDGGGGASWLELPQPDTVESIYIELTVVG